MQSAKFYMPHGLWTKIYCESLGFNPLYYFQLESLEFRHIEIGMHEICNHSFLLEENLDCKTQ